MLQPYSIFKINYWKKEKRKEIGKKKRKKEKKERKTKNFLLFGESKYGYTVSRRARQRETCERPELNFFDVTQPKNMGPTLRVVSDELSQFKTETDTKI